jgi:tetratricopeptide (TPR) repeat protein
MKHDPIPALRQAMLDAPPTAEGHLRLGTALLATGAAREAERELRAAVDLDPKCAGAWVNLGGLLFSRWEFGPAIEANRSAIAADPTLVIAHFNEALGHLQLGAPEQALACLSRAVELEPGNGAAYYHLGIALHALERHPEAQVCVAYADELGFRPNAVSAEALKNAAAGDGASATKSHPEPEAPPRSA